MSVKKVILFDDDGEVLRRFEPTLTSKLREAGIPTVVCGYRENWLSNANTEAASKETQAWLVDLGSEEVQEEKTQLRDWMETEIENSPDETLKSLYREAKSEKGFKPARVTGLALILIATRANIPCRVASFHKDKLYELCAYLITGRTTTNDERWAYTKALLFSKNLRDPEIAAEWNRVIDFIKNPHQSTSRNTSPDSVQDNPKPIELENLKVAKHSKWIAVIAFIIGTFLAIVLPIIFSSPQDPLAINKWSVSVMRSDESRGSFTIQQDEDHFDHKLHPRYHTDTFNVVAILNNSDAHWLLYSLNADGDVRLPPETSKRGHDASCTVFTMENSGTKCVPGLVGIVLLASSKGPLDEDHWRPRIQTSWKTSMTVSPLPFGKGGVWECEGHYPQSKTKDQWTPKPIVDLSELLDKAVRNREAGLELAHLFMFSVEKAPDPAEKNTPK